MTTRTEYLVISPEGRIISRGRTSDVENLLPEINGNRIEIVSDDDPRQPDHTDTVTYYTERAMAYPSVGSQLDMLWHAMREGQFPMVEPWYSTIKAVKDQYPKPEAA